MNILTTMIDRGPFLAMEDSRARRKREFETAKRARVAGTVDTEDAHVLPDEQAAVKVDSEEFSDVLPPDSERLEQEAKIRQQARLFAGLMASFVSTPRGDEGMLAWQDDALCLQTDPEAFFPEKGQSTKPAKQVCLGCDVRQECLDYAVQNDERFGVWGGLSERERRLLKKRSI